MKHSSARPSADFEADVGKFVMPIDGIDFEYVGHSFVSYTERLVSSAVIIFPFFFFQSYWTVVFVHDALNGLCPTHL